ncbi:hypothetical protein Hanom_Chr02g00153401 [Helianthus anomalus]
MSFSDVEGHCQWCGIGAIWHGFTNVFSLLNFLLIFCFSLPLYFLYLKTIFLRAYFMYV